MPPRSRLVSLETIKEYCVIDTTTGCWIWRGYTNPYARARINGLKKLVHVAAYELKYGPIPFDLELDHLCRNPSCVNPDHLEAVSHRENVLRGSSPAADNSKKTHCKHGHEYTTMNTVMYSDGSRRCKTCLIKTRKKAQDKWRAKNAGE